MSSAPDPRRADKVRPFKTSTNNGQTEDFLPDYFNILGMVYYKNFNFKWNFLSKFEYFFILSQIFSMCGLMMKLKWCGKLKYLLY